MITPIVCPTLVGRERELAALDEVLARAHDGRGRTLRLVGEAGVGKSRLVAELKQIAQTYYGPVNSAPVLWLEGRGVEHAMGASYWLFADMLRAHFAEHATHDGNDPADLARNVRDVLLELASVGSLSAEEIDEIGPSLRYATAQVTRAASSGGGGGGHSRPQQVQDEPWSTPGSSSSSSDAWSAPGSSYGDDTPF